MFASSAATLPILLPLADDQSPTWLTALADAVRHALGAVGMALTTYAVSVDVVAFLTNRAGVGILRSALQAEVYLGAFLTGKALTRPLQVEVQTLPTATAVPLSVAGVVLLTLAIDEVRSLLA